MIWAELWTLALSSIPRSTHPAHSHSIILWHGLHLLTCLLV